MLLFQRIKKQKRTRTRASPLGRGTAAVPTYGGNAIAVVGVPIRTLFHVFITKSRSRDFCFCFV